MSGLEPLPCGAAKVFAVPRGDESRWIKSPPRDEIGTPAYYLLDYASVLAVQTMCIEPQHAVLDLCAAPGGKSVAIAQLLSSAGTLVCNEVSPNRNQRLTRTLTEYLPLNTVPYTVTQRDGTRWYQPNAFDRVMLDAPCSAERHLLEPDNDGALLHWTEQSSQELAVQQHALLLRALETVKVGGLVVYCTCSISPLENDRVVQSVLQKARCGVELSPVDDLPVGERTKLGCWMVLPDRASGYGPLYIARLRKTSDQRAIELTGSESDNED